MARDRAFVMTSFLELCTVLLLSLRTFRSVECKKETRKETLLITKAASSCYLFIFLFVYLFDVVVVCCTSIAFT